MTQLRPLVIEPFHVPRYVDNDSVIKHARLAEIVPTSQRYITIDEVTTMANQKGFTDIVALGIDVNNRKTYETIKSRLIANEAALVDDTCWIAHLTPVYVGDDPRASSTLFVLCKNSHDAVLLKMLSMV